MGTRFANGYALLIGINENFVENRTLPDVAKDITTLAKILVHPERFAYPKENIKIVMGTEATRQGILDGLEWLEETIRTDMSSNSTAFGCPYELGEQQLPSILHNKIVEFLTSIPNLHESLARQAFLNSAGLDPQLQNQIPLAGSLTQFFQLLVPTLKRYGMLKDGRNALETILESAKNYVGQEGRAYCDSLIQELHTASYVLYTPTAIIYYSGHCWREELANSSEYYLIPYDIRENKMKSRALRATDFAEAIHNLMLPRLLVILDCCHAVRTGIKNIENPKVGYIEAALPPEIFILKDRNSDVDKGKNTKILEQGSAWAVLSSSRGEQPSYIRKDGTMSVFTYHLIEALMGYAQSFKQGFSEVLVSDVVNHVCRSVPQTVKTERGRDQEPNYYMSGNFPVALLLGGQDLDQEHKRSSPLTDLSGRTQSNHTPGMQSIEGGIHIYEGGSIHVKGDVFGRDKHVYGKSKPGKEGN